MFLEHHVRWETMGLIDLDASFFVQVVIFLVFLVLMNILLFKPLMAVYDERRKRTEGARDDATRDDAEAREMIANYEEKLSRALAEGAELRAELRDEGATAARKQFTEAREQYARRVEAGTKKSQKEYEASRADVEKAAQPLAETIATKLLGTSGGAK